MKCSPVKHWEPLQRSEGGLKQTSCVSPDYLFGVRALSITVPQPGRLHLPASPLQSTVPVQWSTFRERHLKVGLNGLIFPMMSRRRSLAAAPLPSLYCTWHKAKGWNQWNKSTLLISHNHFFCCGTLAEGEAPRTRGSLPSLRTPCSRGSSAAGQVSHSAPSSWEAQPQSRRLVAPLPRRNPLSARRAPEKKPLLGGSNGRSANIQPAGFFYSFFILVCIFAGFQQRKRHRELDRGKKRWTSSRGWCTLTRGWAWQGTPACRRTCRTAPGGRTATAGNKTLETFYSKLWPSRIKVWMKPKPGKKSEEPLVPLSGGGETNLNGRSEIKYF